MPDLVKHFDRAMLTIYRRAKSEANYTASIFFQMLDQRGGLATAKYLIKPDPPSEGYTRLYELISIVSGIRPCIEAC